MLQLEVSRVGLMEQVVWGSRGAGGGGGGAGLTLNPKRRNPRP